MTEIKLEPSYTASEAKEARAWFGPRTQEIDAMGVEQLAALYRELSDQLAHERENLVRFEAQRPEYTPAGTVTLRERQQRALIYQSERWSRYVAAVHNAKVRTTLKA